MWCMKEGRKRLEESMKRLNLDETRIKSKTLANLGTDYLTSEKTRVKNELKKYDNDFMEMFGRMPGKTEKETMRPLYIYYKNLKSAMESKQHKSKPDNKEKPKETNKGDITPQYYQQKEPLKINTQIKTNYERGDRNRDVGRIEPSIHNNSGGTINNINNSNQNNSNVYSFNNVFRNNTIDQRYETFDHEVRIEERFDHIVKNNSANNSINGIKEEKGNKRSNSHSYVEAKKIYSKQELKELEKELYFLKKDQDELKSKLTTFQKDFQRINNRKIKYNKDIEPVQNEYQLYRVNREKMKDIQTILNEIKNK
jgi:hypothetical protein